MFHQARVRLTILYSLLFLVIVWLLSIGAYFWMDQFFQQRYQQEVHDQYLHERSENDRRLYDWQLSQIASDLALNRFRSLLIIINAGLLIIVPLSTWFITGQSLEPVEEAHAREQQFVSDVSHDLRTPLSIMSGELEVALLKNRAALEYKKVIQSSKEEVDRLSSLVESLLFLTRRQTNKTPIAMNPVDLTDIVSSTVSRFSSAFKQKSLKVQVIPPKENIEVLGNDTLLDQLFANLIENAIQYNKDHGGITINISRDDGQARVSVKDTGIGVTQEHQQWIFDRFYRVDTSRTQKGYGLGLSIVKTIAELHNGKVAVSSQPNKGTIFTVQLPVYIRKTTA